MTAINNNNIQELKDYLQTVMFKNNGQKYKFMRIQTAFGLQKTIDCIVGQSVLYKINSDKKQVILKYDYEASNDDDCKKDCKSVFNFNCLPWEKETPKPAKKEKVIVKFNSDSEEEETPIEETPIEEEEVIEETPIEETPKPKPKPAKKEKVVNKKLTAEERKKQLQIEHHNKCVVAQKERNIVYEKEKELFLANNPDCEGEYLSNGYTYTSDLSHEVKSINYTLKQYNKSGTSQFAKDVYNNKRYTMFITEGELDCIQEGLELLRQKREKKGANIPFVEVKSFSTLSMISDRLNKIKNKVLNKKINVQNSSMKYDLDTEDYEEE